MRDYDHQPEHRRQANLTTNDHGDFNAASIAVGTYTLTAEMPGFQKQELTGIVLQVDQTANL